jgi:histone chaperone ASF1
VILLTCLYKNDEFIRIGYYVNNEYEDETLATEPPQKVIVSKIKRHILSEKPRVTRVPITWDDQTDEMKDVILTEEQIENRDVTSTEQIN